MCFPIIKCLLLYKNSYAYAMHLKFPFLKFQTTCMRRAWLPDSNIQPNLCFIPNIALIHVPYMYKCLVLSTIFYCSQKQSSSVKPTEDIESPNVASVPDDDVESGNGASLPQSPDAMSLEERNAASPTSDAGTMREQEEGCVFYLLDIFPRRITTEANLHVFSTNFNAPHLNSIHKY